MKKFSDFWPYYLTQHKHSGCKKMHFWGTFIAIACFIYAVESKQYLFLLLGFSLGYLFAWIGHFFIEKNVPATFRYPFWSILADLKLFLLMISNQDHSLYSDNDLQKNANGQSE